MKPWDFDLVNLHGQQEVTDEDRTYRGSRYAELRQALYENPYRDGASGQVPGPLPMFESTIANAWRGAFGHGPDLLKQASARVIDSRPFDYPAPPDYGAEGSRGIAEVWQSLLIEHEPDEYGAYLKQSGDGRDRFRRSSGGIPEELANGSGSPPPCAGL